MCRAYFKETKGGKKKKTVSGSNKYNNMLCLASAHHRHTHTPTHTLTLHKHACMAVQWGHVLTCPPWFCVLQGTPGFPLKPCTRPWALKSPRPRSFWCPCPSLPGSWRWSASLQPTTASPRGVRPRSGRTNSLFLCHSHTSYVSSYV